LVDFLNLDKEEKGLPEPAISSSVQHNVVDLCFVADCGQV